MSIRLGSTNPSTIRLGNTAVSKIVLGDIQAWSLIDSDAAACIVAIVTAGATVSNSQLSAIDTFFRTGKIEGWHAAIKRFYLPIWGAAGPNAIDWIARGSGTFGGTVTHGTGFVRGDGSTGHFDFGTTYEALGCSSTSIANFGGFRSNHSDTTQSIVGNRPGAGNIFDLFRSGVGSERRVSIMGLNTLSTFGGLGLSNTGLYLATITGTARTLYRRKSNSSTSWTATTTGGALPANNIHALRRNWSSPDQYCQEEVFFWGAGTAFTSDHANQFLAAVQTLWEGCTGLSAP